MKTFQKQFPSKNINIRAFSRPLLGTCLLSLGLLQLSGCALIGLDMGSDHPDRIDQIEQSGAGSGGQASRSPAGWSNDGSQDSGYQSSGLGNPSNSSNSANSRDEDARNERERHRRMAIMNQDIFLGMSARDVQSAWGSPRDIETAGVPGSGNERWVYYNSNSMNYGMEKPRIVYFEQGRVVGWESANR
jgi:hypothetical protein